jgi:hypothetical protein
MKNEQIIRTHANLIENDTALSVNILSGVEADRIFGTMTSESPVPFYILWFIRMVESFIESSDSKGLGIMLHALYESLELDEPTFLSKIENEDLLPEYVGEFIKDLGELTEENLL